jgi:hypothetical protein
MSNVTRQPNASETMTIELRSTINGRRSDNDDPRPVDVEIVSNGNGFTTICLHTEAPVEIRTADLIRFLRHLDDGRSATR